MDLSSAQSSPKCTSDFSIERILSDDSSSSNREVVNQTPSWLCCTRYQPPRIPRSTACRSRRSGRHARVPFTAAQAAALEAAYARAPYLAPPALRALAAALQLRDDRIKIWFQNRRARERRERTGNVVPPQTVTLPSTNQRFSATTDSLWNSYSVTQDGRPRNFVLYQNGVSPQSEQFGSNNSCSESETDSNDSKCETTVDVESID